MVSGLLVRPWPRPRLCRRVPAALVDVVLVLVPFVAAYVVMASAPIPVRETVMSDGFVLVEFGAPPRSSQYAVLGLLGLSFGGAVWNLVWLQGRLGWSLGKRLFGLRLVVVDGSDGVPGVWRCAGRLVAGLFLNYVLLADWLVCAVSPSGRRLSDRLFGTSTVRFER